MLATRESVWAIDKGVDLQKVRQRAGHGSLEVTSRYAATLPGSSCSIMTGDSSHQLAPCPLNCKTPAVVQSTRMSVRDLWLLTSIGTPPFYFSGALNFIISSAGTRPRSLTSMPCALAHSRTSVVFSPFACGLRPVREGRRALPLTRRAAPT